jgi:hypothetical protein
VTLERRTQMRHHPKQRGYSTNDIAIRRAGPDDAADVRWLAERDTRPVPPPPLLVAVVEGRVLAARSLMTGESVADPFRPTAHLTAMLELRASEFDAPHPERRLARWRRREYAHA